MFKIEITISCCGEFCNSGILDEHKCKSLYCDDYGAMICGVFGVELSEEKSSDEDGFSVYRSKRCIQCVDSEVQNDRN